MKRLLFAWVLLISTCALGTSKDPQYPVSEIPEELKKNANLVYRLDKSVFTIEGVERARLKVHVAVTVLNEKARRYGWVAVGYDKLRKITDFSARVFDAQGELIKKMKNDDIIDESSISTSSLYEDNRVKGADLRQNKYPYTIEYEYEVLFKYLYQIPNWYVVSSSNTSIQRSEYIVKSPTDLTPRFKLINTDQQSSKYEEGNLIVNAWTFENIKAYESEAYSRGYLDISPIIYCAPSKFKYEDYEGDMSTWDGLAAWQNSLNKGREALPSSTIAEIKAMTQGLKTDRERIKVIYEFMQSRTRYVSVQLGIGGFQPFEAKVVDEVGYGDCKALSFYTQSLLSAANIKSYYTWVEAGSNPAKVYKDFPNDTFNHIILCVPNKGDTVWLECTSQTIPFGYLGDFTSDRDVLLIKENGAEIVHTPVYENKNNLILAKANIDFDLEGSATISSNTLFFGEAYDYKNVSYYLKLPQTDQEDWIRRYLDLPNYNLNSFSFEETRDILPSVNMIMQLDARSLASKTGKRYFFNTNLLTKIGGIPKITELRKNPIYLGPSRILVDSLTFTWPENLRAEQIPDPVEIQTEFGSYKVNYTADENKLFYSREITINKGVFPPEKYQELFSFFRKMQRADRKKVVLIDKT